MATVNTQQGGLKILWASEVVNIGSITTGISVTSSAIVFLGARLGDPVMIGTDVAAVEGLLYSAFVSAADEIKIRCYNVSAGTLDPASQTFTVGIVKLNPWQA